MSNKTAIFSIIGSILGGVTGALFMGGFYTPAIGGTVACVLFIITVFVMEIGYYD